MSQQEVWRVEGFLALGARRRFSLCRLDILLAGLLLSLNPLEKLVHDLTQLLCVDRHHAGLTGVRSPQVVLAGRLGQVALATGHALDLKE